MGEQGQHQGLGQAVQDDLAGICAVGKGIAKFTFGHDPLDPGQKLNLDRLIQSILCTHDLGHLFGAVFGQPSRLDQKLLISGGKIARRQLDDKKRGHRNTEDDHERDHQAANNVVEHRGGVEIGVWDQAFEGEARPDPKPLRTNY